MSEIEAFWKLCAEAKDRLDVTFNAPDLVPYGAKIVELIQSHPQLHCQFSEALVEAALDSDRCDPLKMIERTRGISMAPTSSAEKPKKLLQATREDARA